MPHARQLIRSRPHLVLAFVVGLGAALALPQQWTLVVRVLTCWNVAVWFYIFLAGWEMARASDVTVRRIAEEEENSAVAVLSLLSFAAVISLVAIIAVLVTAKGLDANQRWLHYAFTGITIIGSWTLVGIIFTFHYAYLYYRSPANRPPLRFPGGEPKPGYWDFLYFSFTISVAAQTSDVIIMTRAVRKVVIAQSILTFFFNAAILGFSINIAAGVIGN
jgi:uncharacterized membrane protein